MSLGPRNDQAIIGTLDGSIMTYDFRYNAQVSYCCYTKSASVTNVEAFYPNKYRKYSFNNANYMCPLAFISTSDGQVSLVDFSDKDEDLKETQLVLFSRTGKSQGKRIGCFKEKTRIAESYLSTSINASISESISSLSGSVRLKNRSHIDQIIREYEPNTMTALLCPKYSKYKYSASFLIGGDTKGRIRYWDIEKDSDKRKHFYVGENEETPKYRRSKYENTIHIISDTVTEKETYESEEAFAFGDTDHELDPSLNLEGPSFPPEAHTSSINALGMLYHSDGQNDPQPYLISCSSDSTIKIWN